jgi:carbamoyl-phosphate synthase large subunit
VACEVVGKYSEGPGNVVERILAGDVDLVVNTPFGAPGNSGPRLDGYEIRTASVTRGIPCITTIQGAAACVQGIEALVRGDIGVRSLQEHHAHLHAGRG